MSKVRLTGLLVSAALLASACVSGGGYKPVSSELPGLKLSFSDPAWTGGPLPDGQQCAVFGGKGATPPLRVEGIPPGANAIIVEFNDLNFAPLSSGGGHGKIGFWHDGTSVAALPAVPGDTAQLPEGSFVEARAQSTGMYASPGYLPPCSGGRGHVYVADVKAVYKAKKEGEENRLLAQQRITIGTY